MARQLVSDELWGLIEPLIPTVPRRHQFPWAQADRRPQGVDRDPVRAPDGDSVGVPAARDGLRFGVTCWRRLRELQQAGVWQRLHELLLAKLQAAELIDWWRAAIDSSHVRAFGGRKDRPQSRRPLEERPQASRSRLWARHAACLLAHRRQPQRHQPADPTHRRYPARARAPGPVTVPAAGAVRRPAPTTRAKGAASSVAGTSRRRSLGPRTTTAPGLGRNAGSSSARSLGCTSTGGCASATNAAMTSTKRSSPSAAA
jgi:transposase